MFYKVHKLINHQNAIEYWSTTLTELKRWTLEIKKLQMGNDEEQLPKKQTGK